MIFLEHIAWNGVNLNGCDSSATLNLTINDSSTVNITTSSFQQLFWNGNTYDTSGQYFWQGVNSRM